MKGSKPVFCGDCGGFISSKETRAQSLDLKTSYCMDCWGKRHKNNIKDEAAPQAQAGKFEKIGISIGQLVDEKNKAYGDSFNKSSEFLRLLYPHGISPEHYSDMLGIIRVFDKLMRIATEKNAFGENPWKDIAGYGILKSDESN